MGVMIDMPAAMVQEANEYAERNGCSFRDLLCLSVQMYLAEQARKRKTEVSAWAEKYGDRVVAILQVYAEALGICDAVREEIADLEAEVAALKAKLNALNEQLKTAVGDAKAAIEAQIEVVKAQIAKLEAQIKATKEKRPDLLNQ